jgi:DNA-binding ferritin-like protein
VAEMKTYLTVWFNSEGASPSEVAERLRAMGFKPIRGYYDHVYDWKKKVTLEDIFQLSDALHETLKGLKVLYKLETV